MEEKEKESRLLRILNSIERVGNKMPSPIMIFIYLSILVILASWVMSMFGVSVVNPVDNSVVAVNNLLTGEYFARMIAEAGANFASFPALSAVLVIMLGVGMAEKTGYFEAVLTNVVEKSPKQYILLILIFTGIIANIAGDAGPIVLPPLAALTFLKIGLNPMAGAVLGYVSSLAAFAANIILGMSDALVFPFTESAAQTIIPDIELNVAMNYYFIFVSTFVLVPVIYFVLTKISLPQMGEYQPEFAGEELPTVHEGGSLSDQEVKAVKYANWSLLITIVIVAVLALMPNSFLANPETGSLISDSPFMNGITVIMTIMFFVPGFVYGKMTGQVKDSHDLARILSTSMADMGSFIVIIFFSSQMMAYFSWSNMGTVIAIAGAGLLENANGIVLIIGFILLSVFVNFFIGSASAKWAIFAPIFVPMFMLLGYHPAFTQVIYRIGDGISNPLTPMQAYIPVVLSVLYKYDKRSGLGSLISNVLPYSIAIGIVWIIMAIIWFLLGLPVGPNSPVSL